MLPEIGKCYQGNGAQACVILIAKEGQAVNGELRVIYTTRNGIFHATLPEFMSTFMK